MTTIKTEQFLTVKELAEKTGISPVAIYERVRIAKLTRAKKLKPRNPTIPFIKLGGKVLFDWDKVSHWLEIKDKKRRKYAYEKALKAKRNGKPGRPRKYYDISTGETMEELPFKNTDPHFHYPDAPQLPNTAPPSLLPNVENGLEVARFNMSLVRMNQSKAETVLCNLQYDNINDLIKGLSAAIRKHPDLHNAIYAAISIAIGEDMKSGKLTPEEYMQKAMMGLFSDIKNILPR